MEHETGKYGLNLDAFSRVEKRRLNFSPMRTEKAIAFKFLDIDKKENYDKYISGI
jgi:hypothetical protein